MRKLSVNGVQLLDRIDADVAFISELAAVGCITWPQREHLMYIRQPRDRNDKLLEFLTRRSVADFNKFISILAKEQSYLVPLLLTGEGKIINCQPKKCNAYFLQRVSIAFYAKCCTSVARQAATSLLFSPISPSL